MHLRINVNPSAIDHLRGLRVEDTKSGGGTHTFDVYIHRFQEICRVATTRFELVTKGL